MSSTTESVKVLSTWASMFGLRVLIALHHKGIKYEYQEEDLPLHKSKLLLDSNPVHKKVPVLLHNGKPICESLIIVQYIDEAWPSSHDTTFLPTDPYHRARARFWADYVDKKIFPSGSGILKRPDGEGREQAKKDYIECLITLDGALCEMSGGGPYFGGQHIGLVDIALAPFLCWFEAYETMGKFKLLDEAKCPHLSKWAKIVVEHPSVKEGLSIAPPHKVVEFAYMLRKLTLGA